MRTTVAIGSEIDVISPAELRTGLAPVVAALGNIAPPMTLTTSFSATVAIGGAIGGPGPTLTSGRPPTSPVEIYAVPLGYRAQLTRLVLWDSISTPATPNVVGWVAFGTSGNDVPILFSPATGTTVCPALYEAADDPAVIRSGQTLVMWGGGLTAGITISGQVQYRLFSDVARSPWEAGE
jgi:hypothetical protein